MSAEDQSRILDMLCSLLSPIGEHRSRNVAPSKGRRAKKRKRKDNPDTEGDLETLTEEAYPSRPAMHDHLTVGFNTTTRYLETLARRSYLSTDEKLGPAAAHNSSVPPSLDPADIRPLAVVFVPCAAQPPILYSHLPLLTKVASLAVPSSPSTRIISLPEGAEDRLKTVLGIPRVGAIGLIDGAPNASSLIELIRQNVPQLDVPWLQEAAKGLYLSVKIKET